MRPRLDLPFAPTRLIVHGRLQHFSLPLSHSLTLIHLNSLSYTILVVYPITLSNLMADGGIDVAGLFRAVPGIINLCMKYGHFLKEKIVLYQDMREITRLDRFLVELVQGELHALLLFFSSINEQMAPGWRGKIQGVVRILRVELEKAIAAFPSPSLGILNTPAISVHDNDSLEKACTALEKWHLIFLRRAVTFLFFADHGFANITIGTDGQNRTISRIKHIRSAIADPETCPLRLGFDELAAKWRPFKPLENCNIFDGVGEVLEFRKYYFSADTNQIDNIRAAVCDLAVKLHMADSAVMGMLTCNGYLAERFEEPMRYYFGFRFQYPDRKTNPHTLRSLLVQTPRIRPSRGDRVRLACKLASAVLYLHSCDFVHKNIRPANILIFDPVAPSGIDPKTPTYPHAVGEPYLVEFDSVRKADAHSSKIYMEEWEKNIYLHPERHRMAEGDEFTMRHDIYSLGVVLLEVCFWDSFSDRSNRGIGRFIWKQGKLLSPESLMLVYVKLARVTQGLLGNRFKDVVISCLLGWKNEEGRVLDGQDRNAFGSAYLSQIMAMLEIESERFRV